MKFLNKGFKDKEKNFICCSEVGYSSSINGDQSVEFTNNGINFKIKRIQKQKFFTLFNFLDYDCFNRKVILAIDSAELRGGIIREKCSRFLEVFLEKVNIFVSSTNQFSETYFVNSGYIFYEETRNETKYMAWI